MEDKVTDEVQEEKEKLNVDSPPDSREAGEGDTLSEQASPEKLIRMLEEKTALAEEYQNRLLRVQADFENFRRRSRQEREEFVKYAAEGLILNLLPVVDNLERALQSAPNNSDLGAFVAGVEMIYRQFLEVLEREGLTPIAAVGQEFDPQKHDAVLQGPGEGQPDNMVLEELQKGYLLRGKVIRPSMVKVAVN